MLLVSATAHQLRGVVGLAITSSPFTSCKRTPPPCPPCAELPWIKFESTITLPVPSDCTPPIAGSPSMAMPPPEVACDCTNDWLNNTWLLAIVPFQLRPMCPIPAPSPTLKLPQTKLKVTL